MGEANGEDAAGRDRVERDMTDREVVDRDGVDHEVVDRDRILRKGMIRLEWQMFFGVLLLSLAGVLWLHFPFEDSRDIRGSGLVVSLMMLSVISGITGLSLAMRQGWFMPMNPVISTLGTTGLRSLTVLMLAGMASATKWNNSNSFAYSLLGCYFIFLLLESCLSIRWHSALVHNARTRRLPS